MSKDNKTINQQNPINISKFNVLLAPPKKNKGLEHFCHSELVSESHDSETPNGQTLTPALSQWRGSKCAFTLAETLITLVIIGVVAALTVPTLIVKYQKEQTVTRLKKAYSALSQTTQRAIADNGPVESWEIGHVSNSDDSITFFNKYLAPYLSISIPAKTYSEGKWNNVFYYLNGEEHFFASAPRAYLNDGTSINFIIGNSDDTIKTFDLYIDINGDKKPNKLGRDIFVFYYWLRHTNPTNQGKFLPAGGPAYGRSGLLSNNSNNCNKNQNGVRCATLIMKDGWQIRDDYPW